MIYEKNSNKLLDLLDLVHLLLILNQEMNGWVNQQTFLYSIVMLLMGFAIVPSQPFGYNYLGGKLLALMCVSHFAREQT